MGVIQAVLATIIGKIVTAATLCWDTSIRPLMVQKTDRKQPVIRLCFYYVSRTTNNYKEGI